MAWMSPQVAKCLVARPCKSLPVLCYQAGWRVLSVALFFGSYCRLSAAYVVCLGCSASASLEHIPALLSVGKVLGHLSFHLSLCRGEKLCISGCC